MWFFSVHANPSRILPLQIIRYLKIYDGDCAENAQNNNRERQRKRHKFAYSVGKKKTIALHALHVRFSLLSISLPSSAKQQRKKPDLSFSPLN